MRARKYTIVYQKYIGNDRHSTTTVAKVLTNDLQSLLLTEEYFCTDVVFEGWPKQEKIP